MRLTRSGPPKFALITCFVLQAAVDSRFLLVLKRRTRVGQEKKLSSNLSPYQIYG